MSAESPTVRDKDKRCQSEHMEKPGRTHLCRLARGHVGEHICICSRKWGHR